MLEFHEVSNIFPLMEGQEFEELKADIKANGLIEPIWTHQEKIVDGRNRYRACLDAGVEPRFREYVGNGSLISFVVSLNLKRRHLNSGQRAVAAEQSLPFYEAEAKERQGTRTDLTSVKKLTNVDAGKAEVFFGETCAGCIHNEHLDSGDDFCNLHRRTLAWDNISCDDFVLDKETRIECERQEKEYEKNTGKAAERAAKDFGTNRQYIADIKAIREKAPEKLKEIQSGAKNINEVKKEIRACQIKEERIKVAKKAECVKKSERFNIYDCGIEKFEPEKQYDFIITDPPYKKEYLKLYEVLSFKSSLWLKDGGLLVAMCGQSYLDNIYRMLSTSLEYYWTAAYLTPGQPTPLRKVNVNTTWKPLLIFKKGEYKGRIFGDVFKSDGNDKSLHEWGQSESGMLSIIKGICLPGQHILDPFCGASTTGVAALQYGCFFDGVDIDKENCDISRGRLNDLCKE